MLLLLLLLLLLQLLSKLRIAKDRRKRVPSENLFKEDCFKNNV